MPKPTPQNLKDRLITAARKLVSDRDAVLRDRDLSPEGKQERLQAARKRFTDERIAVLKDLETISRPSSRPSRNASVAPAGDVLAGIRADLEDSDNPTLAVLDLLARGTADTTRAIASQDGQQLIAKVLRKHGEAESTVQATVKQLATAAEKRAGQQQAPSATGDPAVDREVQFWQLSITSFGENVERALDNGRRTVLFPASPGSGEEPDEVVLDGSPG